MRRPITTLFLLQSLDGKISTGPSDKFDIDKDVPNIKGNPSEGLSQYYDAEMETDLWSINSGRVMAKVGVNDKPYPKQSCPVTFVVIDNNHLTQHGVTYMAKKGERLIIVTNNRNHPVYNSKETNIQIIEYSGKLKMKWMLEQLALSGCKEATIQTGSTLNCAFLREHVIDKINIVIAPILVGGVNTASLIDGIDVKSLSDIGVLELKQIKKLKNSYIELFYDVVNSSNETSEYNDLF